MAQHSTAQHSTAQRSALSVKAQHESTCQSSAQLSSVECCTSIAILSSCQLCGLNQSVTSLQNTMLIYQLSVHRTLLMPVSTLLSSVRMVYNACHSHDSTCRTQCKQSVIGHIHTRDFPHQCPSQKHLHMLCSSLQPSIAQHIGHACVDIMSAVWH